MNESYKYTFFIFPKTDIHPPFCNIVVWVSRLFHKLPPLTVRHFCFSLLLSFFCNMQVMNHTWLKKLGSTMWNHLQCPLPDSTVCSMQMFLSIGFAAAGAVGAIYSLSVAALGLSNGPTCLWNNLQSPILQWGTPFASRYRQSLWPYIM